MPASLFSVRRFLIIFSIAWLVLMTDHALLLYFFDLPLKAAIVDSVISNILLLMVCILVLNTIRYYTPASSQYLTVLGMCILLTLIWLVLCRWLLSLTLGDYELYKYFLSRSLVIRFSIAFLVLAIVTMIGIVW